MRVLVISLALIGLIIRAGLLTQCLWYDEMFLLRQWVSRDWASIVSGDYLPNNHVLYTLLAKFCAELTGSDLSIVSVMIRLPAVIAGIAAGLLIAWPMRRASMREFCLLGALAMTQPWLVSFSGWARGYTLMLALCLGAVLLLWNSRWRWYVLAMTAAIYTHPLAVVALTGQGIMIALLKRQHLRQWLWAAIITGLASALLYAPLMRGAVGYFSQPQSPAEGYGEFLSQSLLGVQCANVFSSKVHIALGMFICTIGAALAWKREPLRPLIATFAATSLLGALVPLLLPSAGAARAMVWLIPLYAMGIFGLALHARKWMLPAIAAALLFFAVVIEREMAIPAQPIEEALISARKLAQDRPVAGVYMASDETKVIYGNLDAAAYTLPSLEELAPYGPVMIVFYPDNLRRDQNAMWQWLERHYKTAQVLPGRISNVLILEPLPEATTLP